ncbi:winged helix family transcriptional regulator [Escherichia coli]|nr:winged helix family transcriptional regulator [Escherichia coli]EGX10245.1 putative transcriptional regulator [Escherichia coli STEC_MHI813]EHX8706691.1 winged helix-turn-helix domain-containing protein [Escherichia coli]OTC10738.1 winged helix family transcriptional regulator [Escherichia coli]TJQ00236.1 winged helix family transcriptional regulator [Escherichia coli]GDG88527.1 hypothetical protein BvCmsKKP045_00107 [Escherichia coli]
MSHIINGQIMYDEIRYSVSNVETHDEILLPATAARLLALFIKYHGTIISRDEILNYVWDKYGYNISNNTLAQYVSLLRKNFKLLGVPGDIIVTVPKSGFLIPEIIEIDLIETSDSVPKELCPVEVDSEINKLSEDLQMEVYSPESIVNLTTETKQKKRFISGKYYFMLFFLVLIISFSYCYFYALNDNKVKQEKIYKTGMIDSCPIYVFNRKNPSVHSARQEISRSIAEKYIPCIKGGFYVTQQDESLVFDGKGRVFISRCFFEINDTVNLSECKSIYYYE